MLLTTSTSTVDADMFITMGLRLLLTKCVDNNLEVANLFWAAFIKPLAYTFIDCNTVDTLRKTVNYMKISKVVSVLAMCLQIAVQMMKLAVALLAVISLCELQPFPPSYTTVNYTVTTGAEVGHCVASHQNIMQKSFANANQSTVNYNTFHHAFMMHSSERNDCFRSFSF